MPERPEEILKRRARELARTNRAVEDDREGTELLEFVIGGERYAVETSWVVEVLPLRALTTLPGAPGFIVGIVHVRGRILCLNDLSRFLGLPQKGLTERDKIMVLRKEEMEIAVLAEAIIGIRRVPAGDIGALLDVETAGRGFLKGVTPDGTSVMDAVAILSDSRLVVNQVD